jgi:hypothetical protein
MEHLLNLQLLLCSPLPEELDPVLHAGFSRIPVG